MKPNPHLLPAFTTLVSRKDAFSDDNETEVGNALHSPQTTGLLLGQLNRWTQASLESNSSIEREHSSHKKRKKTIATESPFALVSSEKLIRTSCARSNVLYVYTREPKCSGWFLAPCLHNTSFSNLNLLHLLCEFSSPLLFFSAPATFPQYARTRL